MSFSLPSYPAGNSDAPIGGCEVWAGRPAHKRESDAYLPLLLRCSERCGTTVWLAKQEVTCIRPLLHKCVHSSAFPWYPLFSQSLLWGRLSSRQDNWAKRRTLSKTYGPRTSLSPSQFAGPWQMNLVLKGLGGASLRALHSTLKSLSAGRRTCPRSTTNHFKSPAAMGKGRKRQVKDVTGSRSLNPACRRLRTLVAWLLTRR